MCKHQSLLNILDHYLATDDPIRLGREPMNECTGVQLMCRQCPVFEPPRIIVREDATLKAVIGPSANPRGYTGITG